MKWMAFRLFGTWLNNINSKLSFNINALFSPIVLFVLISWWLAVNWLALISTPPLSIPTQDGGKEVLSMHQILLYLLRCSKALVPEEEIANMLQWEELEWQKYAEECKGMIVTNPGTVCSSTCTFTSQVWMFHKNNNISKTSRTRCFLFLSHFEIFSKWEKY